MYNNVILWNLTVTTLIVPVTTSTFLFFPIYEWSRSPMVLVSGAQELRRNNTIYKLF